MIKLESKNNIKTLRILAPIRTSIDVTSVPKIIMENIISELRKKVNVQVIWLVFSTEKIAKRQDEHILRVLDIHDFKNAVEIIKESKPDIVYAGASFAHIHYSLSIAAKHFNIPVMSGFQMNEFLKEKRRNLKLVISLFFRDSVDSDIEGEKKFMKRGIFFLYKSFFLYKTLRAVGKSDFSALKELLIVTLEHISLKNKSYRARYANTIHWLENESILNTLIKEGFPPSKLFITGSPMYDNLFRKIKTVKKNKNMKIPFKILLITSPLVEHGIWKTEQRNHVVTELVKEITKNPNRFILTIKIHPITEKLEEYKTIISKYDTVKIYQKNDIIEYVEDCDVVISFSSLTSASIIALFSNKPIIISNFYNADQDLFVKKGLAINCDRPEKIIPSIEKALCHNPATPEKITNFVREFMYKDDGKASERISKLIIEVVNKNQK